MARLCTIYALSDPRLERVFENVRYVGKTEKPLPARLYQHCHDRRGAHKNCWIKSLERDGLKPAIWALAFCSSDTWEDVEISWISKLSPVSKLTNVRDGGGAWTEAIRKKISDANKGRVFPHRTQHQIESQRQKLIGRKQDPDRIEARAIKLRGQKRSPEVIANMRRIQSSRTWKTGGPHSEATKLKIANSKLGKAPSKNARAALIKKLSKPVVCVETGQVFGSSAIAAKHIGVAQGTMSRASLHGFTVKGLTWRKVTCPEQL